MSSPSVQIDVDSHSGVWTTDGLPMLYVPRHFFLANHAAVEEAIGREAYAQLLYEAGYQSARKWCAHEAAKHGISGMTVFRHYMERLSRRGWGLFDCSDVDPETGCGHVHVRNSCFTLQGDKKKLGKLCYMFSGWGAGALSWVGEDRDRPINVRAEEILCANEGHSHCVFALQTCKD